MTTVYVGMGLTQAPKEFREEFQHELKAALTEAGFVVTDFVGLTDGTSGDVYRHDKQAALAADICVFVADHPSIGLGMEIAYRQAAGTPMVIFAHKAAVVTRMLIGMCEVENVELVRYETVTDIIEHVKKLT